jgi:hypothetical protein
MLITTIIYQECAKVIMYNIKVKNMSKNIKKKRTKIIIKLCKTIHQDLKIKKII